mmetsp:Transcript_86768/g.244580  ORF Transcript_86768/g.244580 Transcript_86768/m.244580 type:complete len:783 (+) Transcript_86768:95-2443(+)
MGSGKERGNKPLLPMGLPKLIGSTRGSVPLSARASVSQTGWYTSAAVPASPMGPLGSRSPRTDSVNSVGNEIVLLTGRCSSAPSSMAASERPGSLQIMQWVEHELAVSGITSARPCVERVRIYSTAFAEVIDMLPTYRPFLLSLHKEYDGLIQRLQSDFNAVAPLEGRLKTMRAESLSFVGESMTWFQMEIDRLRLRVTESEARQATLEQERVALDAEFEKLKESCEKDRITSSESHQQNLDILRHLDRCEKQVEQLRKQEKDLHSDNKELERRLKERETRIQTVEGQLNEERNKLAQMVPKEECDVLREEIKKREAQSSEWQEAFQSKEKDYLKIVETYSKKVGQSMPRKHDMRPLTPRPTWYHCHGLLDPDSAHSVDKAEMAQRMLQHVISNSRILLSAYGLSVASQKSTHFQGYFKHPLAIPLHGGEPGAEGGSDTPTRGASKSKDPADHTAAEAASPSAPGAAGEKAGGEEGKEMPKDGSMLEPDVSQDTPMPFRHKEPVKNLKFSRKKTAEFIDDIMSRRSRIGSNGQSTPFISFMLQHIKETANNEDDAFEFAVNMYAAVRRFSAEPDFLAYLLLILGKLPDTLARDNKQLCSELLRIFTAHFETGDGTRVITKQKFFYGLKEVLQNKDNKLWQDMVTYFPAGGPDVQLNFESLLLDDMYVLSPIVFALRLQHLEEIINLADRLEKAVQGTVTDGSKTVKYGLVDKALRDDPLFELLQPDDYARAFGVGPGELEATTEQDMHTFLELMKTGEVFHILFFPSMPSDDAELTGTGEMT